jgi:hypothetical protein
MADGAGSGSILAGELIMSAPGEDPALSAHMTEGATGMPMPSPSRDYSGPTMQMAWYAPKTKYGAGVNPVQVPGPRAAHSCNLLGNTIFTFGGWNGEFVTLLWGARGTHCSKP